MPAGQQRYSFDSQVLSCTIKSTRSTCKPTKTLRAYAVHFSHCHLTTVAKGVSWVLKAPFIYLGAFNRGRDGPPPIFTSVTQSLRTLKHAHTRKDKPCKKRWISSRSFISTLVDDLTQTGALATEARGSISRKMRRN